MKKGNKTKFFKTILPIIATSIIPISVISASCENKKIPDSQLKMSVTQHSFKNYNPEYTIKESDLSVYRIKNQEEMAFVDLDEFLKALDGFIDPTKFTSRVDEENHQKIYEVKDPKTNEVTAQMVIDWEKNTIFVNGTAFFWSILKPQELTDGNQFLKLDYEAKYENENGITFDLSKYDMDIIYKDNKILIPFLIFNTLFMSQNYNNIYFNGDTFTNVFGGIDSYSSATFPPEARQRIKNQATVAKKPQTIKDRVVNFNHLLFAMDYFYGLKDYKKITSFKDYIGNEDKKKILSTNPEEFHEGYINVFHKKLNELHTRLDSFSYYDLPSEESLRESKLKKDPKKYYGEYYNRFFDTKDMLEKNFHKKYPKDIRNYTLDDHIKFIDNDQTAILRTFGFFDGTKEQNQKNDAWKYDTYYLMYEFMKKVKEKETVKNILVDLSMNGGGSVYAMIRALGFMTNKQILNREYNELNKIASITKANVDTQKSDEFKPHDYDQKYKWNILVSLNTFSAANQGTSIVKEMGIAKIIGQKTGGGMSAVFPITFNDGTTLTMSSPNNAVQGEDNKEIESGIDPDYQLDYKDFYDDNAIKKAIAAVNKQ